MHLAWRWFTGLGFDQEVPHHSTFSKNRHGRFRESKLFEQLFEQIVKQCVEVGLVQGKHLSVDGSFVEANASKESRIPREQLAEAAAQPLGASVSGGPGAAEPGGRAVHQQDQISTTDPFYLRHQGRDTGSAGILRRYLVDNQGCVIVGVQATAAHSGPGNRGRASHARPFRAMARTRSGNRSQLTRRTGTGSFCNGWRITNITPYMRTRDGIHRKRSPFFGPERFARAGTRSLYLPCRSAPELRRRKSSQSRLDLHRDTQTVWPVRAPTAMHECGFPMPGHPSARAGAATRTGVGEHG